VQELDALVEEGLYSNRSEVIKEALRDFVRRMKRDKEEEEFVKGMLKKLEPTLAEDWDRPEDEWWDTVGGLKYEGYKRRGYR